MDLGEEGRTFKQGCPVVRLVSKDAGESLVGNDGLLQRHSQEGCILSPGGHRGALGYFVKFTNPSS